VQRRVARVPLASARAVSAAPAPSLLPLPAPAQQPVARPSAVQLRQTAAAESAPSVVRTGPGTVAGTVAGTGPRQGSSTGPMPVQRLSAAGPATPAGAAQPRQQQPRGIAAATAPVAPAASVTRPVQLSRVVTPQVSAPVAPPRLPVTTTPLPAAAPPAPPRAAVLAAPQAAARPSVQRSGGGPSSGSAPSAPAAEPHLDELARRLVAPLSRLLRAELRLDRERIGRLRDPGR